MAEQAEETEQTEERKPAPKRGLHGWKAALAIFGCGSLAAFGIFGAIVGVLSLVVSTTSSGVAESEQSGIVEQTGEPREELEPGALDLCADYVPEISDLTITETLASEHADDALESDLDPSDDRSVSGSCAFEVTPHYGTTGLWYFEFSFDAVIEDSNEDREQLAGEFFEVQLAAAEEGFGSIESQSDQNWADEAHSFYGLDQDSVAKYSVVAQTRSAVYEVTFSGDPESAEGEDVPELDFERQAGDVVNRLDGRFSTVIPE